MINGKHFNEITDVADKLAHLLYAAKIEGMYGMAIVQISAEYGEDITQEAITHCKEQYPYLFQK